MQTKLRNDSIIDADNYREQQEIESLKRTNKPFYYYKAADLLKLENVAFKTSLPSN